MRNSHSTEQAGKSEIYQRSNANKSLRIAHKKYVEYADGQSSSGACKYVSRQIPVELKKCHCLINKTPAMFAAPLGTAEPHQPRQLGPVDRVQPTMFRHDRHGRDSESSRSRTKGESDRLADYEPAVAMLDRSVAVSIGPASLRSE